MVTSTFKQAAFLQETGDVFLALLIIAHDDISPSIRVVNNTQDITSNGNVYTAFPFDIELPDAQESGTPRARLTIDNVSREIAQSIRSISSPPTITIQIIRAAAPDTIELTWAATTLRNIKWDFTKMSGDLLFEGIEVEPFPAGQFSPASFPGLF